MESNTMSSSLKYRYEIISEEILNMINNGLFPDGRLFPEDQFIKHFKVGKITVYNALKKLVESGTIVRIKNKGTFVNKKEFLPASKSMGLSCIPLLMPETGHFYGNIYNHISHKLLNSGLIPANVNYNSIDKITENTKLTQFLKSGVKGVIIYGNEYWKHRLLDDFPEVKSVFIDFYDSHGKPPYGAVFIDYEKGIYDTARTLISRGKKKIVMIKNEWSFKTKIKESHMHNHPSFKMDTGFKRAMLEAGLRPDIIEIPVEYARHLDLTGKMLRELLFSHEKPDAVICSYDALAVKVVIEAILMKIKIPDELSVTGFFNTPWCEECPLRLSSVSMDEEFIASEAVNMITSGKFPSEPVIVKPQFIERETT